jgi:hypothetical protein
MISNVFDDKIENYHLLVRCFNYKNTFDASTSILNIKLNINLVRSKLIQLFYKMPPFEYSVYNLELNINEFFKASTFVPLIKPQLSSKQGHSFDDISFGFTRESFKFINENRMNTFLALNSMTGQIELVMSGIEDFLNFCFKFDNLFQNFNFYLTMKAAKMDTKVSLFLIVLIKNSKKF